MEKEIYPINATLVERMIAYMEYGMTDEAEALAIVGDHLEECASWELEWL